MQRPGANGELSPEEAEAAATGVKALVPVGRPFLDYVLHSLADAGIGQVCLVIGKDHSSLRERYEGNGKRLDISIAVQEEPRGTADALLAAAAFINSALSNSVLDSSDNGDFAMLNSDNYYPSDVLRQLQSLKGPGLVAFDRAGVLARGKTNLSHERMAAFAVVDVEDGELRGLVEKPDPETYARFPEPVCVSLNCWRFSPSILDACRAVKTSPRGELELTDAVLHALERGQRFEVAVSDAAVLDLTSRDDVGPVRERLAHQEVFF